MRLDFPSDADVTQAQKRDQTQNKHEPTKLPDGLGIGLESHDSHSPMGGGVEGATPRLGTPGSRRGVCRTDKESVVTGEDETSLQTSGFHNHTYYWFMSRNAAVRSVRVRGSDAVRTQTYRFAGLCHGYFVGDERGNFFRVRSNAAEGETGGVEGKRWMVRD